MKIQLIIIVYFFYTAYMLHFTYLQYNTCYYPVRKSTYSAIHILVHITQFVMIHYLFTISYSKLFKNSNYCIWLYNSSQYVTLHYFLTNILNITFICSDLKKTWKLRRFLIIRNTARCTTFTCRSFRNVHIKWSFVSARCCYSVGLNALSYM